MAARNQAPKAKAPAGKGLINWDEQMAAAAQEGVAREANSGGGNFVSIKGGILAFQDAAMPNNEMAVVVLDFIHENIHYPGKYGDGEPTGPDCFAFGRHEADLVPHEVVMTAGTQQSESCSGCPLNEWGSAETGKGKGCRNTRRLAIIPAGSIGKDGRLEWPDATDHFETAELAFFKLPVTSVKGWAGYVKQLAATHNRPTHGFVTKIKVVPDQKTMFRVLFEAMEKVPNELMEAIVARHTQAKAVIEFPYSVAEAAPAPVALARRAPAPVARQATKPVARPMAKALAPAARSGKRF